MNRQTTSYARWRLHTYIIEGVEKVAGILSKQYENIDLSQATFYRGA